ncbi:hypothetical protein IAR50_005540 [Cryptococcus sp. DSM 104548]
MSSSKPVWVGILEQQLKENPKALAYAFSTLASNGDPKVRHVIHRGITPSSILLTTTDTRMSKPVHLSHSPRFEIAWWLPDTNVQFRITGQAYTIPPTFAQDGNAGQIIKELGVEGKEEGTAEWWQGKREELWEGVSGHLRAGFARPAPGAELKDAEDSSKWPETIPAQSDDEKDKELVKTALDHFALIALRPTAVEYLELKPIPNRRTQWKSQDGKAWTEYKVVP